jgi:hypothetical protein
VTGLGRFNSRRLPKDAASAATRIALVTAVVAAIALAAPALLATARADDASPSDPVTDTSPPPPDSTPPPDTTTPPADSEPLLESTDTTPPDTIIDAEPGALVNSASAGFAFSSTESDSSFECSLDGAPPTSCTSPAAVGGLADGPHTFSVAAVDAAGNPDPSPASYSWTIDTVAPAAPTGLATTSTTSTEVDLAWTSADSDVASYQVLRDGTLLGTSSAASFADPAVPGPGTYIYTVVAVDMAGNASPATDPLTVDVPGPGTDPGPSPDPGPSSDPPPDPAPAPPAPDPAPDTGPAPASAPTPDPAPVAPAAVESAAAQPQAEAAPAAPDAAQTAAAASVAAVPAADPQPAPESAPVGSALVKFVAETSVVVVAKAPAVRDVSRAASLCAVDANAVASTRAYPTTPTQEPRSTAGTRSKQPRLPSPSRELPPGGGGSSPVSGSFGGASGGHANGETGIVTRVLAAHRTPVGRLLSLAEPTRRPVDIRFLLERPG